jgi:hypothetical protein
MSSNVIQLHTARAQRNFESLMKAQDPDGLFDIPFDEIVVGSDQGEGDGPFSLSARAAAAFKRLFSEFGITSWPTSYFELMGAFWYCKALHQFAQHAPFQSKADEALWWEVGDKILDEDFPELKDSFLAYRHGNGPRLVEIHEKWMPLSRMVRHFDEEDGWLGGLTGPLNG